MFCFFFFIAKAEQNIFPVGKQYTYQFSNDVFIKDFKEGKPVAYRIIGTLKVANILALDDTKLLKFTLESPELNVRPHGSYSQTEFHYHKSPLNNYRNKEFYALWKSNNITDIYFDASENVALVNVKKAVASLFHYKTKEGDYSETRASGNCDVSYIETSQSGSIKRMKRNCVLTSNTSKLIRSEVPLQVSIQNYRSSDYAFYADGSVSKVESRDYFHIALEGNRNVGGSVDSIILIHNDGSLTDVNIANEISPKEYLAKLTNYRGDTLETEIQSNTVSEDSSIKKIIQENVDSLKFSSVGTLQSAQAFLNVFPVASNAKKDDLIAVLKSKKFADVKV